MLKKSYVAINKCPFCLSNINENEDPLYCVDCRKPHHTDCWNYNLNHCASFGCKGTKTYRPIKDETAKVEKVEKITVGEVEAVEVKPIQIKPLKKKAKKSKKNKKNRNTINIVRDANGILKPEYFIPDYVYAPLITPEEYFSQQANQKKHRNIMYQPIPGAEKFIVPEQEKRTYEIVPIPEPFIPDYVFNDIRKNQEELILMPKYIKPPIITSFDPLKALKQKAMEGGGVPLPEAYIPEYVYKNLSDFPKKRKRLQKQKRLPRLPQIFYPEKEGDYERVPEPEIFIPEYVHGKLEDGTNINILPQNLIKTKKCLSCDEKIKVEFTKCPHCKKNPDQNPFINTTPIQTRPTINQEIPLKETPHESIFVNLSEIKNLCITSNGRYLTFGCKDKNVQVVNLETKEKMKPLEGHLNHVNSVAFSPDGKHLASGSVDTTIKIWDINSATCLKTITGNSMGFNSVKYSPDGFYLITTSGEGMIKIWGVESGMCLRFMKADMSWVTSAAFSPNMEVVASGDSDMTIRVWDVAEGTHLKSFLGHFDSVNSIVFSPNGRYIASGSSDCTIKIWDNETSANVRTLKGHTAQINALDYSPDGRYIVSASFDKTIRIWDVAKSICVRTLVGHKASVNSVIYTKAGTAVISGSDDKTIKIWKLV